MARRSMGGFSYAFGSSTPRSVFEGGLGSSKRAASSSCLSTSMLEPGSGGQEEQARPGKGAPALRTSQRASSSFSLARKADSRSSLDHQQGTPHYQNLRTLSKSPLLAIMKNYYRLFSFDL